MSNYTIGSLCKRFSAGSGIPAKKIHKEGLYPVYGANGIRGYTDTYNFDGKCAIIGRQGAECGNVHYFEGKAFMTEHAIVAEPNEDNVAGYLAYKLGLMNLGRYQGQSAQPGLSANTLSLLEISVPSFAVQQKVFNYLKLFDSKITNNNAISKELESMAKTIYDYWFLQFEFPDKDGKPYKSNGGKMVWNEQLKREIPEGWEVKKLEDLAQLGNGINYNKNISNGKVYKIVNVRDITSSSLLIDEQNLSKVTLPNKNINNFLVNSNDILIARSGTPGAVRILATTSEKVLFAGFIIHCLPNNPDFKWYLTYTLKGLEGTTATTTGGSILQNVSQTTLKSIPIVLPPTSLVREFNNYTLTMILKLQNLLEESQQLQSLRDFLLPMLMNGQVIIED